MALYADSYRGRYPVWQSLDHPNFFPGSGIVFVTVTVGLTHSKRRQGRPLKNGFNIGRFLDKS